MSRLTRDGTTEPLSRDQILRHARGQGNINFPVQLTTSRIGNLIRLIHTLLYVMTIHTYIHTYIHTCMCMCYFILPGICFCICLGWLNLTCYDLDSCCCCCCIIHMRHSRPPLHHWSRVCVIRHRGHTAIVCRGYIHHIPL